jgi:hypothetical protein
MQNYISSNLSSQVVYRGVKISDLAPWWMVRPKDFLEDISLHTLMIYEIE